MAVDGQRDPFLEERQRGRIEALKRWVAELQLKNEKLRMAAISAASEENPKSNCSVTLTNAITDSRPSN